MQGWTVGDLDIELKPCRRCGAEAVWLIDLEQYAVYCANPGCQLWTGGHDTPEAAAAVWNQS